MYILLNCIGVDNIIHSCYPNSDVCLCGMKIKKKLNSVTPKIIEKYKGWCGTCDYSSDDIIEETEENDHE